MRHVFVIDLRYEEQNERGVRLLHVRLLQDSQGVHHLVVVWMEAQILIGSPTVTLPQPSTYTLRPTD